MTAFVRRLANAACAFQTGHSVRDLDRVMRRRLQLHGGRLLAERTREAEEWADGFFAGAAFEERARDLARSTSDLVKRAVEGRERIAQTGLLQELAICRSSLYMRRRQELVHWELFQSPSDGRRSEVEPDPIASPELYGKFYEGLLDQGSFDLSLCQEGLGRWNWHVFLRWLRSSLRSYARRLIRSCGPP